MTIYDEVGVEVEKIPLHEVKTARALHALMADKGFQLRPPEERERIKAEHREAERRRIRNKPRNDRLKMALLVAILLLFAFLGYYCCCRPCWRWIRKRRRIERVKEAKD